jgi:hypothetical protein
MEAHVSDPSSLEVEIGASLETLYEKQTKSKMNGAWLVLEALSSIPRNAKKKGRNIL